MVIIKLAKELYDYLYEKYLNKYGFLSGRVFSKYAALVLEGS